MTNKNNYFSYGKDYLTVGICLKLASGELQGVLVDEVIEKVRSSRKNVEKIVDKGDAVYGINTGFGPLCNTQISKDETRQLQYNILKSHSVGIGENIPTEIAKIMLILKVHALAQGFSGVAVSTLEQIIWHIEEDIIPVVPSQGSVGASGDLAPLSHLFLPLIGLGKVEYQGKVYNAADILKKQNRSTIELGAKEGLALINGTQFIAAYGVKVVEKLYSCLSQADLIGAMMLDGLLGSAQPFLAALHQLRPYKGTQHVAQRMSILLTGSEMLKSHIDCDRVQDPYSLRCIPQVHGASRNAALHLKELLEVELNSVTDNPVVLSAEQSISGGNFHGQPLALPLDYACLAASEIGNISDRRTYLSFMGTVRDVPKLLMKDTGTNSGFMMLQYTGAALASENKGLCFPASADSIPTSMGQEDHVSMGSIGGRKALRVLENVEKILAVELVCAAQAMDFHKPLKSSKLLEAIHEFIRTKITFAEEDRVFSDDMNIALSIIQSKKLLEIIHSTAAANNIDFTTPFEELFEQY